MVKRNAQKYGTIDRVPHFVLKKDFMKNMPYAQRSTEDNIPLWARVPYHLKYVAVHKEHLKCLKALLQYSVLWDF